MLHALQIRNLAIIDELNLELSPGFTVLTGETGAGKSILIDALGLIIGTRGEASLVRGGADKAEVSAQFDLAKDSPVWPWLEERELREEHECLVRRVIQSDGRSRAFINGRPVAAADLRTLGEMLVEIFGQGESQTLMRSDTQRDMLDDFGRHGELCAAVAATSSEVQRIDRAIEDLRKAQNRDPEQLDYLRFQLRELEALALGEGELDSLDAEHKRLANAGRLLDEGGQTQQLLYGGDSSIYDQLSTAGSTLQGLIAVHADFGEAASLVGSAQAQVREAADGVRRILEKLDLDPERLAEVERRLGSIHDLARKHRVRAAELPARLEQLKQELGGLEGAAEQLQKLGADRDQAMSVYRKKAQQLGGERRSSATRFAGEVTERIRELGMPNARFEISIEDAGRELPSPHGEDLIRYDFSANPGQPLRPLAKVASGGELSRISLALQVSLRHQAGAATMIFDEVDAGIGGGVAEIVGRQLRALGGQRQVLCVTHLAQVAAQGQQHFAISKQVSEGQTRTRVATLGNSGRVDELARMIGGEKITTATTALARDLLKTGK
jgi:DNA repair protein RecN (Recombination protein N)